MTLQRRRSSFFSGPQVGQRSGCNEEEWSRYRSLVRRMCAPVPLVEGLDLTSLFAGRMYNTVSSAKA